MKRRLWLVTMRWARVFATFTLCATSLLGGTGCIKSTLLKGQIQSTRQASSAVDTIHDYEIARSIAYGGVAQMEGMHKLAPENEDALFMLTKSWAGIAFGFIEDDLEVAEDLKNKELAEYHKQRALAAYDRAIQYGLELLSRHTDGFNEARKNDASLRSWLNEKFEAKEDAQYLFWLGYAWIAKINVGKDDPELVGDLWVGVAMVERAVQLDPEFAFGNGLTILAAYHARTAQAELDDAKKLFDQAFAVTQNRSLLQKFNYATRYLCGRGDKAGYVKQLQEIVDAGDIWPEQRLPNAIAKRRARRYLGKARMAEMRENCGFTE